jgi:hypothetical protein
MKSRISDILTIFLTTADADAIFSTPPPDRATRSWAPLLLPSSETGLTKGGRSAGAYSWSLRPTSRMKEQ